MENMINQETHLFKSIKQGFKLFGIVFIDILVVFLVTYFFDVDNFFTNGGLNHLKSTTTLIRLVTIICLWTTLIIFNYKKAKANNIFHVSFKWNRNLIFYIPIAVIFPILITYILYNHVNFTVIDQYQFFLRKSMSQPILALINTTLQYAYWIIECFIVIFIIDAFQNIENYFKRSKFIPWGGIGLTFTWGLEQLLTKPNSFSRIYLISIIAGIIYSISKRNFFIVLLYLFMLILLKR